MWFWEVLGIEPTDDKTAIKRAYTKLAHETSPEDDPDGYARLHEAYRNALDYASGKYIFIENDEIIEQPVSSGKQAFDFSSVRDPNDPYTLDVPEIENAIEDYKKTSNVGSFADLFDREQKELLEISAFLFKLYSALAVKTDDPRVWNGFFNEPILNYVIYDEDFRAFMTDSFPEDDKNRSAITEHIGIYKQDVADRRLAEEKKKARARLIKKKANIWLYLAAGTGTAGFILFFTDYYLNLSGSLLLSTACAIIAFAAYCPSRYNIIMTEINNEPEKPAVPSFMYIALSLLFIGIGIASIFEYDSFTNISGMCSLAIILVTIIAEILLMTVFKPSLKHYS